MHRIWVTLFIVMGLVTNYWVSGVMADPGSPVASRGSGIAAVTDKLSTEDVVSIAFHGTATGDELHRLVNPSNKEEIDYLIKLYNRLEEVKNPKDQLSNPQLMVINLKDGTTIEVAGEVFENGTDFVLQRGQEQIYANSTALKKYIHTLLLASVPDLGMQNIILYEGNTTEEFAPLAQENQEFVQEISQAIEPLFIAPRANSNITWSDFQSEKANPEFAYLHIILNDSKIIKNRPVQSAIVILTGYYRNQVLLLDANNQVVYSEKLPSPLNLE